MSSKRMEESKKFEQAIDKIKDELRIEGISGMDAARHSILYNLSRFLTKERIKKFKSEKFDETTSWEYNFELSQKNPELAYNNFGVYKDCLISKLDVLFGTNNYKFEVKDILRHCRILEILNKIDFEKINIHMDILGFIYEIHLKSGSADPRDLGQFFTNRQVCDYMIKLCDPKCITKGVPETMCDPTMGTGGFLSSYMKYFKDKVDWNKQQLRISGFEIENKVASFARMSMFMESDGICFDKLIHADSLKNGIGSGLYDINLGNMPFGIKNLKYTDCNSDIKSLKINGTKSEPLFLQMMMLSLKDNGRCAVVVPNGMIENVSNCHCKTRKHLLENFNLKRVIRMNGKMFIGTDFRTSILFFEKKGKTKNIEFWDIDPEINETFIKKVSIDNINKNYSLSISDYIEPEKVHYNSNIKIVKLKDVLIPIKGKRHAVSEGKDEGKYPLIRSSKDGKVKWMDSYVYEDSYLTVGNGGVANFAVYSKFNASTHTLVYNTNEKTSCDYICIILQKLKDDITSRCFTGSGLQNLNIDKFMDFEIPLPSLEIQQQIIKEVGILIKKKEDALKIVNETNDNINILIKSIIS